MSLKIALQKTSLPACTKPFVVRSAISDAMDFERFVSGMLDRTTLTKTDIIATMNLFGEELGRQLAEGKSVKTPVGTFFICASGSMDTPDDDFSPGDKNSNHDLRIHFRPESGFEAEVCNEVRVVRTDIVDQSAPRVRSCYSSDTGALNVVRSGDLMSVHGFYLKFDRSNVQEGLFFIDAAGTETRCEQYGAILPKSIATLAPAALAAGTYTLALRSMANGKTLREGRLEGVTVTAG